ncbi:hypothetical protein [Vibrio diabolicus]
MTNFPRVYCSPSLKTVSARVNLGTLVGGVTDILWGSFWGAAENEQSMVALENVISASGIEQLPVLTPFKFSLFSQNDGWGDKITPQDLEFWRTCVKYA